MKTFHIVSIDNYWLIFWPSFTLHKLYGFFHSGATDTFEFSSKHVGEIASICIGHITKDGKKVKNEASWHVMEVVVTEMELGNEWVEDHKAYCMVWYRKCMDDGATLNIPV